MIVFARARVAADFGVVGERRHRRDLPRPQRRATQTIEPIVVDFRIRIEQDHIAVAMEAHAKVAGGDKTLIGGRFIKLDKAARREFLHRHAQFNVGRMIVDDDQAIGRFLWRRKNAVETTQCLVMAVVDWNDHIDERFARWVPTLLQAGPIGLVGSLGRRDGRAILESFNRRKGGLPSAWPSRR